MRAPSPLLFLPFTLAVAACKPSGPPPVDPSTLPPVLQRGLADLQCPEKVSFKQAMTARGLERWCEDPNGKMLGPYELMTPEGEKRITGSWANNQPDGGWVWYWEGGQRRAQVRFSGGKRQALWSAWHPNGQQAEAGEYLDGRLAGAWTAWHDNGAVAEEGGYRNGQAVGDWKLFNAAGEALGPDGLPLPPPKGRR